MKRMIALAALFFFSSGGGDGRDGRGRWVDARAFS